MSLKVQNVSKQMIPIIIPTVTGGNQINLKPRETVVLALDEPTSQLLALKSRKKIKFK
jgi:hypothetical protein